jgi:hypothetical protein
MTILSNIFRSTGANWLIMDWIWSRYYNFTRDYQGGVWGYSSGCFLKCFLLENILK